MNTRSHSERASGLQAFAFLLAVVLALAALLGLTGCLGQQARTHVLTPAIRSGAAYAVKAAKTAPPETLASFQAAVEAGDTLTIKALWPSVYASAVASIDARSDVGEEVKESLREPLVQTDAAIGRLKP